MSQQSSLDISRVSKDKDARELVNLLRNIIAEQELKIT